MKRREFIRSTAFAGTAGALVGGCAAIRESTQATGPGFDVHPFVKHHPEAVFICRTDVSGIGDSDALRETGRTIARELIVPVSSGGWPLSTRTIVKPNWTGAHPIDGKPVFEKLGINTDPHFIEGWILGMRSSATGDCYIRESGSPQYWQDMGYYAAAERANADLRDLSTMDMWELKKGRDLNFVEIPEGVVFREAAYMAPVNEPGTFLVSIAKYKSHGMGITAAVKNIQGLCPKCFKQFCTRYDKLRETYEKPYHRYFRDDFERHIEALYRKHLDDGIPRWDRPGPEGGIWMEQWCQRMLDSLSVTPTGICIVEGIYSQDGNGFGIGPHEKLGEYGVTSRDYMSNVVVFGMDPFRVDIISHWLGGHEPGNFGLFHLAIERGMSDVLDPHDIPVYLWKDGKATLASLEDFRRTSLVTYYLQRDYGGQNEEKFHLCNEPFDYSAWKRGARVSECTPSIRQLGRDSRDNVVMELDMPKKQDACVEVVDSRGEVLWHLYTQDLEPGVHQVVWDCFSHPGIYNVYVKGMGWDKKTQMVTYA